jgi:hypothetical protein
MEEQMERILHFCVKKQTGNVIHYYDGILTTKIDFTTADGYDHLKQAIADNMTPKENWKDIILCSLSEISGG